MEWEEADVEDEDEVEAEDVLLIMRVTSCESRSLPGTPL
jgi:hypothetical protein